LIHNGDQFLIEKRTWWFQRLETTYPTIGVTITVEKNWTGEQSLARLRVDFADDYQWEWVWTEGAVDVLLKRLLKKTGLSESKVTSDLLSSTGEE